MQDMPVVDSGMPRINRQVEPVERGNVLIWAVGKVLANREQIAELRASLLEWYARHRRELPWRRSRDPYAIWVSEIMLQQTRVAVVVERYQAFLGRFPTVFALAVAPEQEVLALWSGLGYYRRARMLHKAAQVVMANHQGIMPKKAEELRTLPGIGGYTAAAIASIAHGERVAVVDGNVERVVCRLAGWSASSSTAIFRRKIENLAANLVDPVVPGDFNQALMELGATVCLPRNPQCLVCPVSTLCRTRGEHKTARRPRTISREVAYALCTRPARSGRGPDGPAPRDVLLEQRPPTVTVMPGMWELPALRDGALPAESSRMTVRHAIMNVNYMVRIFDVREEDLPSLAEAGGERRWVCLRDAGGLALTGLARKVLAKTNLITMRSSHSATLQPSGSAG
jgi:A/G-specific adenine glycosylase